MEYSVELVSKYLNDVAQVRGKIFSLYNNSLYEDGWTTDDIKVFEASLEKYKEDIIALDELIPQILWNDPTKGKAFNKKYQDLIKKDFETFELVKIRHDAYKTYRGFRDVLVMHLNNAVGFVTGDDKRVFELFVEEYSNTPLYNNKDKAGNITYKSTPNLANQIYARIGEITNRINKRIRPNPVYKCDEIEDIFLQYVKARQAVFAIFNMITSSSEVNGYSTWHNQLYPYITDKLKDIQLKQLYTATKVNTEFLPCDDYQQIMDDRTWNAQGIYESKELYESWFDDELAEYNRIEANKKAAKLKSQIKKINMLDHEANKCKIMCDGHNVFAAVSFYPGDIVEICPTRIIDKSSLYSKDMREVAFEVIPNQEWVLPFGYCQYYAMSDDTCEPNVDFLWDPIKRVIVIKAINKILKHEKLCLNTIK